MKLQKSFKLEEYLKNPERNIETRDGRKVRIICTDANHCSNDECGANGNGWVNIIAIVDNYNSDIKFSTRNHIEYYYDNGVCWEGSSESDIVFCDEVPDLTEFDKAVQTASWLEIGIDDYDAIKANADHLRNLLKEEMKDDIRKEVREEIIKEYPHWVKTDLSGFGNQRYTVQRGGNTLYDCVAGEELPLDKIKNLPK